MATKEDYVSFETAKLLKEKGFDGFTMFSYSTRGTTMCGHWENEIDWLPKCTLQMAMKWLREVHHIHVCPEYKAFFQEKPRKIYHHWCNKIIGIDRYFKQGINDWDTLNPNYFYFNDCKTYHDSYEDACKECIDYALRNLIEEGGKE